VFWQGATGQVLLGFLSNLLFVLILTAVGVVYVSAVLSRRSRPLRRLFGIGEHLPNKVRIMVSSIYLRQGGALGVDGPIGFYGPVMNQSEYVSAQLLRDAIRTRPASRPLRALLDQLGLLDTVHDPIVCDIEFSPQYVDGKDGRPIAAHEYQPPKLPGDDRIVKLVEDSMKESGVYILVGGPAFNVVVAHILSDKHAPLTLDRSRALVVARGDGEPERTYQQRREGSVLVDYFVLQKISEYGSQKSTVFVCAGLSSLGTAAAVGQLASRWRHLEDKYGGKDFALLYEFDNRRNVALPAAEDVDKALATVKEPIWQR